MIKEKISSEILNKVSAQQQTGTENVFVCSSNFNLTKKFLDEYKFSYKPYRFAKCFSVVADYDDINILSCQNSVSYISSNTYVQTQKLEKNFIKLENLTENKYLGQGQTICFIDTGIYPHADFILPKNRIIKFIDLINKQNIPYDDNGHGTFVAGIACGNGIIEKSNSGFAPLADIISIKALANTGNSNSNTILDAMEWVFQNHKAYNIGIVCLSLGAQSTDDLDPLSKGAEALWKRGIIVVAAAGNNGPESKTIMSPGKCPYIITVGALDIATNQTANFSSRGPTIYGHKPDLLAPAVNVTSCCNSTIPYTEMSGTSVATPIIAAICADIKCKYPKMTNEEVKSFLLSHCKKITGDQDTEGAGYISFENFT